MSGDGLSAFVRAADRTAWLASLFAPEAARPALLALAAYRLELRRIVDAPIEPLAAEIRLQWWRDAIADVGAGAGRSLPLVDALRDGVARYGWPPDALAAMSEAHIHDLYADPFADFAEFDGYAGEAFGAPVVLAAMALDRAAAPAAATAAGWAGVALAAADACRAAPADFARGRTRLPAATFAADPAAALAAREIPPGAAAAMRAVSRHGLGADGTLRRLLPAVPPSVRAAFLPALLARTSLRGAERRPLVAREPSALRQQLALWLEARWLKRLPEPPGTAVQDPFT